MLELAAWLVLAAGIGVLAVLRRRPAGGGGAAGLEVLRRVQLGPRSCVAAVRFGGRLSLIGVGERGFCVLDRLKDESLDGPAGSGREGDQEGRGAAD